MDKKPYQWSIRAAQALDPTPCGPLCLEIKGAVISGLGAASSGNAGDLILDERWILAPGLINAHDHLELNSFPLLGQNRPYGNFYQWVDDVQSHWHVEPLPAARKVPLVDRLRLGGLKNLLNGVTTVCHHNPYHRCMAKRFPVAVLKDYRFLQSLEGHTKQELRRARRGTEPLFVHVADGIDARAQIEFDRLPELLPLDSKLVIVHGLGMTDSQIEMAAEHGCRYIWCPISNDYLYAACAPVEKMISRMTAALGSDSAVSGSQGLLDDLRFAAALRSIDPGVLVSLVTCRAAQVLGLARSAARLAGGYQADVLVFPALGGSMEESLLKLHRSDIGMVIRDGHPIYGDAQFKKFFEHHGVEVIHLCVDGREKLIDKCLPIPWETLDLVRAWTPLWQGVSRQPA